MTPLWFWELPKSAMGVWAPVYSGFPTYQRLMWPNKEEPVGWVRIG